MLHPNTPMVDRPGGQQDPTPGRAPATEPDTAAVAGFLRSAGVRACRSAAEAAGLRCVFTVELSRCAML